MRYDQTSPRAYTFIKDHFMKILETGAPLEPSDYELLIANKSLGSDIREFFSSFFENTDRSSHFLASYVAEFIRSWLPYIIIDKTFYLYRNGVYTEDTTGARMKAVVTSAIRPASRSRQKISEVMDALSNDASKVKLFHEVNQQPKHWINFRNGYYDPIAKIMHEHDPEYLSLNQLPFEFYPEESYPGEVTDDFLNKICNTEEDKEMLLEYIGYSMTSDTSLQRMLVLYGLPGSGKSTILELFRRIIGEMNTSGVSLQKICDNSDRFSIYSIMGKQLNICADLSKELVKDPAKIKLLLGEDTVYIEKKGAQGNTANITARFAFSTNDLPAINASDDSFFRRLLVLRVDHVPDVPDPSLPSKLFAEVNHMIHLCTDALGRFYQRSDRQTIASESSKHWIEIWRSKSDTVSAFLVDEKPFKDSSFIRRPELYRLYTEYCSEEGRQPLGKAGFKTSMINKGYLLKILDGYELFQDKDADKEPGFTEAQETPFDS